MAKVNLKTYPISDPCCSEKKYYDYYNELENTGVYHPSDGGFPISINRVMNSNCKVNQNDSLLVQSKPEQLYLSFNSNWYQINTDTSINNSSQVFHHTINLRNKNCRNVYEIIDTKVSLPSIVPKGYYFSFTGGLIGYYLTNNELWLIN